MYIYTLDLCVMCVCVCVRTRVLYLQYLMPAVRWGRGTVGWCIGCPRRCWYCWGTCGWGGWDRGTRPGREKERGAMYIRCVSSCSFVVCVHNVGVRTSIQTKLQAPSRWWWCQHSWGCTRQDSTVHTPSPHPPLPCQIREEWRSS